MGLEPVLFVYQRFSKNIGISPAYKFQRRIFPGFVLHAFIRLPLIALDIDVTFHNL